MTSTAETEEEKTHENDSLFYVHIKIVSGHVNACFTTIWQW